MTGGATGAASISLQRHVGRAASGPTELKRVFSWLAIGPAVSNFIGPLSAGLMIDYAGSSAGDTTGYRWRLSADGAAADQQPGSGFAASHDLAPIRSASPAPRQRAPGT